MKIRSFLLSMLVVAGFSACSDDVIDNGGNEVGTTDATPAYLTISFSANSSGSSRSTADDANNIGDQDGSAEDSEHYNVGTTDENRIENALVVVVPSSTTSASTAFAKVYTIADADKVTDANKDDEYGFGVLDLVDATSLTYKTGTPIKLSVGTYKVLVVANPIKDLWTIKGTELNVTGDGLTTVADVEAIYENIVNGTYDSNITNPAMPWTGNLIHETIASTDAAKQYAFMMANKAECTVKLEASETLQVATVEIERVVSKITFRHTGKGENKDRYPIEVDYAVEIETVTGTVDGQDIILYRATLNKDKSEIFISKAQDGTLTAYTASESNGVTTYTKNEDFSGQESDITYVTQNTGTVKWYVEIVGYALVNLSKEVNYVRHTGVANANAPFGTLDGSNFLITPYWNDKNAVTFDEDNEFEGSPTVGTWFYNILSAVSTASEKDDATVFKSFNADYQFSDDEKVEGDGTQHPDPDVENSELANIGETLAYCLENSTDIEHQVHGLSTGIAFQAKMYAENGSPITTLYRCGGNVFTSIKAIQDAYKGVTNKFDNLTESSTDTELDAVGVTRYNDNTCYYYTTEIKHFDNGKAYELGNMEFAIMRNNIYSLSITGINRIGDPFVDPTPGPANESKEAALSVQAKIMPWIVRYHDIEF